MLTAAEQVGEHLRAELCRGAWGGRMPGGARLAVELGVGRDTVEAALQILEQLAWTRPLASEKRPSNAWQEPVAPWPCIWHSSFRGYFVIGPGLG